MVKRFCKKCGQWVELPKGEDWARIMYEHNLHNTPLGYMLTDSDLAALNKELDYYYELPN